MLHIPSHDEIRDETEKNHQSYVLITCDQSSVDGEMNVEMSYEGDPTLISYLLEGAQSHVDDVISMEE